MRKTSSNNLIEHFRWTAEMSAIKQFSMILPASSIQHPLTFMSCKVLHDSKLDQ